MCRKLSGHSLLLCLLIELAGCAALTDSQRKSVANYAKLTQAYTQYPSEVARTYVALNYEVATLLIPVNQPVVTNIHTDLVNTFATFEQGNQNSQRVDDAINILRQYAKALEALSSADLPGVFGKNAELFGKSVDNAVTFYNKTHQPTTALPIGFGKLAADAISLAGRRYINHKQAAALRNYMAKGEELIKLLNQDSQRAFTDLENRWQQQKRLMAASHTTLLQKVHEDAGGQAARNYYTYQINKDMRTLIERSAAFDKLLTKTAQAMGNVYKAHESVLKDIQQKRPWHDRIADVQNLYEDLTALEAQHEKLTRPATH
ncbi:hypothetical protein GCM10023189_06820 [Nibrella saemangeumensis]|uniref:DUF3829 domain-containing protein n=1 Tax=Nibrella saemangeumensis TaxID=1084526 RepID=A0ABP8MFB2_9BACT